MPSLVIVIASPPTEGSMLDQLLASGAVVLLVSQPEQVRSWLAGDLIQKLLPEPSSSGETVIRIGHLTIDPREHRVFWRGHPLPLSEREFAILQALAEEPRRAWSFRELQKRVWASEYFGDKALVMVAIRRLRKKLREAGVAVEITSVRGFGFRLTSG